MLQQSRLLGFQHWSSVSIYRCYVTHPFNDELSERSCTERNQNVGPMPNVMADLPSTGGAICSTPQSFAVAKYTGVPCSNAAKTRNPLKLPGVPQTNEMISAVRRAKVHHIVGTCGDDIAV